MADVELGPLVPDAVRDVWEHFNGLHVPDELKDPDTRKVYQAGSEGKCMLCRRHVGSEAVIQVNLLGITEVYCSHICQTDMYIRGWLTEKFDDMVDALKFRSQEPVR